MMQTKLHSLLESFANIFIGYVVAVLSQLIVFPLFEIQISFNDNLMIGLYFTGISLVRSYVIRRWFTAKTEADI